MRRKAWSVTVGRGGRGPSQRRVFTKLLKDRSAEMRNIHDAKRFLEGMETFESKAELLSVLQDDRENGMACIREMLSFINSSQDVTDLLVPLLGHVMNEETGRPGFRCLRDNMLNAIYRVPALMENLVAREVVRDLSQPAAEKLCSFLRALTKPTIETRSSNSVRSLAKALRERGDVDEARILCAFLLLDETEESIQIAKIQESTYNSRQPAVACWVTDREPAGGRHDNDHLNFRDVRIIPTVEELTCTVKPYLPLASGENNFIDDPVAALLDRNFRLLREDAISSMRENLAEAEHKCWKNARIVDLKVFTKRPSWSIAFIVQCDNRPGGNPNWKRSRALMHGSVVALCRQGRPARLGTIVVREDGIADEWLNSPTGPMVGLSFELGGDFDESMSEMVKNFGCNERYCTAISNYQTRARDDPHLVVLDEQLETFRSQMQTYDLFEISKSFFAYQPILKTLQQMDSIPLSDELVMNGTIQSPKKPEYLPDILTLPARDFGSYRCDVNNWPCDDLVEKTSLDSSQADALKHSFTSPVALMQGPPGTGKTFIGALVARVIRENTDASILCVCYTNHALDQFLEHMIDAGERRIVRIGGRTKSERVAEYRLKALARKESRADSYVQRRIKQVHAQLYELQKDIDGMIEIFKAPLGWEEPSGGIHDFLNDEDPLILSFLKIPRLTDDDFTLVGPKSKKLSRDYLWKRWQDGQGIPGWLSPHMMIKNKDIIDFEAFWQTPLDERMVKIEQWRRNFLQSCNYELEGLIEKFNTLSRENQTLCHESELEVFREARIIGATTSGAALNHDLLSSKATDVVIVEEAGEVLESHILTALSSKLDGTRSTKHLILIGDHKQLPPKVENYNLKATSGFGYNLDCSLFERLVLSGKPSATLEVQHRMRPAIADLIRKQTYPSLCDHPSVSKYPSIKGVSDNVVFVDHKHSEDGADIDNTTTKSNAYEADLCLEIVRFLLLQGYRSAQVVILTPYLGQLVTIMSKIKSTLKDVTALVSERDLDDLEEHESERMAQTEGCQLAQHQQESRSVRCSSIDNYQGEEADIIIVSLVRSNKHGNIGFLKEPQRVNVLLSRARYGMFLVGDSSTLLRSKKGRDVWEPILEQLSLAGRVMKGLPTTCQLHPNDAPIPLSCPSDFRKFRPNGGCSRPCESRLPCGHACPLRCHPIDQTHEIEQKNCCEPCMRFPPGCDKHPCRKLCKEECGPCTAAVAPVALLCGHLAQNVMCYQAGSSQEISQLTERCKEELEFKFACGHEAMTTCKNSRSARPVCPVYCGTLARCQHPCRNSCGECDGNHDCKQKCSRSLFCGHVCDQPCHGPEKCGPCKKPCAARCAHSACPKKCNRPCSSCVEKCDWVCPHQGQCKLVCSAPCTRMPCNQRCPKKLECGHQCPSVCGEDCPRQMYCQECGSHKYKSQIVDMISLSTYSEHDVDEDPMVFLPCGHFFAVSTLDGLIEIHKVYERDACGSFTGLNPLRGSDVNEKSKQCPDCRAIIHSVRRYGRILRLIELRSLERKHLSTANDALRTIEDRLKQATDERILGHLDKLEKSIRKSPMRIVYEACASVSGDDSANELEAIPPPSAPLIKCLELRGRAYGQWSKQDSDANFAAAKKAYLDGIAVADGSTSKLSGATLRLSLSKLILRCCVDVDTVRNDVNALLDWILKHKSLHDNDDNIGSPSAMDGIISNAQTLKDELSKMSNLSTIQQVMEAMREELSRGYDYGGSYSAHWYECPNGHPYFIADCGGAMVESRCPECQAIVGGGGHQLASGNRNVTGVFRDALTG